MSHRKTWLIVVALVVIASTAGWYFVQSQQSAGQRTVDGILVPRLSTIAAAGETAYDANCRECHGQFGTGTDKGPPFLHRVYHPGHHGDPAFVRAVAQGTRSHHWQFGDMPPQPKVGREDVDAIIRFVRELQQANGIF